MDIPIGVSISSVGALFVCIQENNPNPVGFHF